MECIRQNLAATRLSANAEVVCLDAATFLGRKFTGAPSAARYDLIFADPPYTTNEQQEDFAAQMIASPALVNALADDGFFVLEKSPRHSLTLETNGWTVVRQKRYGTTEVIFLRRITPLSSES